jgi:bisphosphoglycerate-independent phosphoglycerate mutase (AlkP superfamily)
MESDRAYAIDSDMRAKRIKTAIELLDKVYDEEYGMEYIDQIKDIYGDNVLDHWFEDTGSDDGSSFLRYEYEKWDNCEEVEQTKNRLFKLSREKQIRAEKLVWEFISHNIRGWWD